MITSWVNKEAAGSERPSHGARLCLFDYYPNTLHRSG